MTTITCHLGLATPDQILEDVLCEHEEYLRKFVDVFRALMENEEALSAQEKHYVGLMAACRHKSSVLVSEQRQRFTDSGGPAQWLEGLSQSSPMMQALHSSNITLAHKPWMMSKTHIENLMKAGLSLPRIVHSLAVMAYFHAMASMLHALGIEAASGNCDYSNPCTIPAGTSPRSSELAEGGVKVLLQRMKNMKGGQASGQSATAPLSYATDSTRQRQDVAGYPSGASPSQAFTSYSSGGSPSQAYTSYSTGGSPRQGYTGYSTGGSPRQGFSDNSAESSRPQSDSGPEPTPISEDDKYPSFSIFSPDMDFKYEDFYRRGGQNAATTLKYQHLWEELGFTMLAKFTSQDLADAMDSKFQTAINMTYNTCGDQSGVNTAPFRRAIWNYTQGLYGIRRDDYDYSHVNILLDRHLKMLLKTMSVTPERLAGADHEQPAIVNQLRTSEQVHIVILATEARLQVELIYALIAVEKYCIG